MTLEHGLIVAVVVLALALGWAVRAWWKTSNTLIERHSQYVARGAEITQFQRDLQKKEKELALALVERNEAREESATRVEGLYSLDRLVLGLNSTLFELAKADTLDDWKAQQDKRLLSAISWFSSLIQLHDTYRKVFPTEPWTPTEVGYFLPRMDPGVLRRALEDLVKHHNEAYMRELDRLPPEIRQYFMRLTLEHPKVPAPAS